MAYIFAAKRAMALSSVSDMDSKLSSLTSSTMLEDKVHKPLLALVDNFSEQHNKQRKKFKGLYRHFQSCLFTLCRIGLFNFLIG